MNNNSQKWSQNWK